MRHEHHGDERAGDDDALQHAARDDAGVAAGGPAVHKIVSNRLHTERQRGWAIHDDVDPQQLQCGERRGQTTEQRGEYHDHRRQVHGELELDESLEILVNATAPVHGLDNGGKGIVQHHDIAGFLGHLGAGDAHGDAHVRVLDGGRVVDAVAGHRHHIALGFQSVHHAHLDNRRAAGDHADAADFAGQFLVAHFLDLARLDGDMPLVQNAEFVGDGRGGHDVVAGEHLELDARLAAALHGTGHILAQGIHDGHEAIEHHAGFQIGTVGSVIESRSVGVLIGNMAVGEAEHSAGLRLELRDLPFDFAARLGVDGAQVERLLRAALGKHGNAVAIAHHSGHALGLRRERIRVEHRRALAANPVVESGLVRGDQQCAFGGVADEFRHRAGLGFGGAREGHVGGAVDAEVLQQHAVPDLLGLLQGAARRVVRLDHGHAVLGQCAGFVRADHVDAADGLARHHLLDQRVLLGHFDDVHREARGHDGRQAFGHGGHDQRYGGDERLGNRVERGGAGSHEPGHLKHEHQCGHNRAHHGDHLAELRELLLQRRHTGVGGAQFAGDLAELGVVAHGGDHGTAIAGGHEAAGIQHVRAVGHRGLRIGEHGVGGFGTRHAFAGERGFVGGQIVRFDEARIGRQLVAGADLQYVADGDVSLRHQRDLAVAHHGDGRVVIDVVQRFECLGAATLHHHGDGHGQGDGEEDAHAFENVGVAAGHGAGDVDAQGDGRRDHKHDEHRVGGRLDDAGKHRFRLRLGEGVGAVLVQVVRGLFAGQALMCIGAQRADDCWRILHEWCGRLPVGRGHMFLSFG